jgi:hypothetical protein
MRPLTWTGGEPVARQRARRVRRCGPEKRTIAKAWHRAPARPYYDIAGRPRCAAEESFPRTGDNRLTDRSAVGHVNSRLWVSRGTGG